MGLYTKEKRDGGIYPVSEQATAVLDVLRSTCIHLGVKVFTECEPVSIKQGMVYYLEQKTQKKQIHFDKLILASPFYIHRLSESLSRINAGFQRFYFLNSPTFSAKNS